MATGHLDSSMHGQPTQCTHYLVHSVMAVNNLNTPTLTPIKASETMNATTPVLTMVIHSAVEKSGMPRTYATQIG